MTGTAHIESRIQLRLYIIRGAPNSSAAQMNLEAILADLGADRFAVELVDCIAEPLRALEEGIIVTPTLVKVSPQPSQTIIGTLADRTSVAAALQVDSPPPSPAR